MDEISKMEENDRKADQTYSNIFPERKINQNKQALWPDQIKANRIFIKGHQDF